MNRNAGVDQLRDVGEHLGFVRKEAPKAWWLSGASSCFHNRVVDVGIKEILGNISDS
jgi:hypothetical protein